MNHQQQSSLEGRTKLLKPLIKQSPSKAGAASPWRSHGGYDATAHPSADYFHICTFTSHFQVSDQAFVIAEWEKNFFFHILNQWARGSRCIPLKFPNPATPEFHGRFFPSSPLIIQDKPTVGGTFIFAATRIKADVEICMRERRPLVEQCERKRFRGRRLV